jgi:hypothetical protein
MLRLAAAALLSALVLAVPSASAGAKLVMFSSPSHNIGCAVDQGFARCDVRSRTWKPPAKPKRCMLDWGQGLLVGATGRGQFVCAGDTTLDPSGAVLPYGRSRGVGRFSCTSRIAGMTCRNARSGHGFTISRTGYRRF